MGDRQTSHVRLQNWPQLSLAHTRRAQIVSLPDFRRRSCDEIQFVKEARADLDTMALCAQARCAELRTWIHNGLKEKLQAELRGTPQDFPIALVFMQALVNQLKNVVDPTVGAYINRLTKQQQEFTVYFSPSPLMLREYVTLVTNYIAIWARELGELRDSIVNDDVPRHLVDFLRVDEGSEVPSAEPREILLVHLLGKTCPTEFAARSTELLTKLESIKEQIKHHEPPIIQIEGKKLRLSARARDGTPAMFFMCSGPTHAHQYPIPFFSAMAHFGSSNSLHTLSYETRNARIDTMEKTHRQNVKEFLKNVQLKDQGLYDMKCADYNQGRNNATVDIPRRIRREFCLQVRHGILEDLKHDKHHLKTLTSHLGQAFEPGLDTRPPCFGCQCLWAYTSMNHSWMPDIKDPVYRSTLLDYTYSWENNASRCAETGCAVQCGQRDDHGVV